MQNTLEKPLNGLSFQIIAIFFCFEQLHVPLLVQYKFESRHIREVGY